MAAHEIQPEANETTSNEVTHSQLWQSLLDLVPRQLPSAPDLMYAEVAPIFASVAQDALAELLEKGYQTNRKPIPPSTPFHPVQPTVKLPPSNTNVDLVKLHALFRSTTSKPLSKCYLQFYSELKISLENQETPASIIAKLNSKLKLLPSMFPQLQYYGSSIDFCYDRLKQVPDVLITRGSANLKLQFRRAAPTEFGN